ncbi:MAG: hypothetical protein U0795_03140 [Pirellulales bacterium]
MSSSRRPSLLAALVAAGLCWTGVATPLAIAEEGSGDSFPTIVKVEEDWELEVGEPSTASNAPQVTMVMTPFANIDGYYFLTTVNHQTHPDYVAGGLQVQLWRGEDVQSYHNGSEGVQLEATGEKVKWTQRMELKDSRVRFSVENGHGNTWGSFGGDGNLKASFPTTMTNLISYNPYVSITSSGISFAGNRVASLTLKQIRWYSDSGQVYSVSAPIDIDTDLDPWN